MGVGSLKLERQAAGAISRGAATWYCYLLLSLLMFLLTIQGNVIPFLQSELDLTYEAVSLHSAAIAAGMIVTGMVGERVSRRIGRKRTLELGASGLATGAILLCLAPAAWASVASCGMIGLFGALIPVNVPPLLTELHRAQRDRVFSESAALSYAFCILAPLSTSFFAWIGLGWRYAVSLGAIYGVGLLIWFARLRLPEPARTAAVAPKTLPLRYWVCWCVMIVSVAIEFCVLLWAPAYLETVSGFSPALAAGVAAAFPVGMMIGRIGSSRLVQTVPTRAVFFGALLTALPGFAVYWGVAGRLPGALGIFVLGLGVAPLYPLALGFAISAAHGASDAASARLMVGVGLAILTAPTLLGAAADRVGLRMAHLTLPVLIAAAVALLLLAKLLERPRLARVGQRAS
jgi:fucose permease